jgi:hypothetical protein
MLLRMGLKAYLTYNPQDFTFTTGLHLNELLSIFKDTALLWSDGIEDIKGIDALLNGDKS